MKTAKGILIITLAVVLCLGAVGTGIAAGGNGNGKGGGGGAMRGNDTGTCAALDITAGPEVTVSGTVHSVGDYGQGISIDTEGDIVTVFGIGPLRYWEDVLEVARPAVGDVIEVAGREVTFSDGTMKLIAFEIAVAGEDAVILLRDDDGLPLWRGEGSGWRRRHMKRHRVSDDASGV